jgi:hypothetical protein
MTIRYMQASNLVWGYLSLVNSIIELKTLPLSGPTKFETASVLFLRTVAKDSKLASL